MNSILSTLLGLVSLLLPLLVNWLGKGKRIDKERDLYEAQLQDLQRAINNDDPIGIARVFAVSDRVWNDRTE